MGRGDGGGKACAEDDRNSVVVTAACGYVGHQRTAYPRERNDVSKRGHVKQRLKAAQRLPGAMRQMGCRGVAPSPALHVCRRWPVPLGINVW